MKMASNKENVSRLAEIMKLASRDSSVMMALFSAYIDSSECMNLYTDGVHYNTIHIIDDAVQSDEDWREAVEQSGIVEEGVRFVIDRTFDNWHIWYFLLDATNTILDDPDMSEMVSLHDRIVLHGLYDLWRYELINEHNWEQHYDLLREKACGE